MPDWFPLVVAIAGIGLMYLLCIRPMRRGTCGPAGSVTDDDTNAAEGADRRPELDRLRAEIAQARHDLERGSSTRQVQ